jgi:predicted Zn-dependent protease
VRTHAPSTALRRRRSVAENVMRGAEDEAWWARSWNWEYNVIDEPDNINAFALPGGKVKGL